MVRRRGFESRSPPPARAATADLLDDAREDPTALGVGGALLVLDGVPLGMAGHVEIPRRSSTETGLGSVTEDRRARAMAPAFCPSSPPSHQGTSSRPSRLGRQHDPRLGALVPRAAVVASENGLDPKPARSSRFAMVVTGSVRKLTVNRWACRARPHPSRYSWSKMVRRFARSCRTDSTRVTGGPLRPSLPVRLTFLVVLTPVRARRARGRFPGTRPDEARARPRQSVASRSLSRSNDWRMPYGARTTSKSAGRERQRANVTAKHRRPVPLDPPESLAGIRLHVHGAVDADHGNARPREGHHHAAGARAELQHASAVTGAVALPEEHVAPARRPGVLPVVVLRVLVPAVPAFRCSHWIAYRLLPLAYLSDNPCHLPLAFRLREPPRGSIRHGQLARDDRPGAGQPATVGQRPHVRQHAEKCRELEHVRTTARAAGPSTGTTGSAGRSRPPRPCRRSTGVRGPHPSSTSCSAAVVRARRAVQMVSTKGKYAHQ